MLQNKKGQIEIHFNWIFVLVVGGILLIFFISLISSQKTANDEKIAASLSMYFETAILSSAQQAGVFKEYAIPLVELDFVCNQHQDLYYYSLGNIKIRDTKFDMVFSPSNLKARSLYTWTVNWDVPYRAGTFLFLSNPLQAYIFYDPNSEVRQAELKALLFDFPTEMNRILMNDTYYPKSSSNFAQYTYIFLKDQLASADDQSGKTFDFVNKPGKIIIIEKADSAKTVYDAGNIYFINLKDVYSLQGVSSSDLLAKLGNKGDTSAYVGKASLMAGIFSDTEQMYQCGMHKAFQRYKIVNQLHQERVAIAVTRPELLSSSCKTLLGVGSYSGTNQTLRNIQNQLDDIGVLFIGDNGKKIYELNNRLDANNNHLAIQGNCLTLY